MRVLPILGCAALLLGACGPRANGGCESLSVEKEIVFSNADAPDIVTATAQGATCGEAALTLAARNAAGDALWTHESTYAAMKHGGPPAASTPPANAEEVRAFLAAWADVSLLRTGAAPAWREGAAAPGGEGPFTHATPLDRAAYEALRTGDAPMACYASGADATACVAADPNSAQTIAFMSFGP